MLWRDGRASEGNPEDGIRHHSDEHNREVDPGELVAGPGVLRTWMGDEFRGEAEEHDAGDDGDREVDGIERRREEEGDARERHDRRRAGNRQRGGPLAPYGREHREARPPVVLPASVTKGPAASRRPAEAKRAGQE